MTVNSFRKILITSLSIIGGVNSARALPVVAESAVVGREGVLTLYPDSEDPNKFYFMPNSAVISKDSASKPAFSFTYWGLSANSSLASEAGAYMVFSLRLMSDSDQKKALESFYQAHPNAGIAVLPVMSSTIAMATPEDPNKVAPLKIMFSELNIGGKAGRAEDEIGGTAVLTRLGAIVMRKALLSNGLAMKYCYKFQGLGPNMDARVSVDMSRVYEYFKVSASEGWWWLAGDVTKQVENLKKQNIVSIEVNGGNASDFDYATMVAETLTKRMFVSEVSMTPGQSEGGARGWSFSRFQLNSTKKSDLGVETWNLKRRDLVEREFCPSISLKDITRDLIRDAEDFS